MKRHELDVVSLVSGLLFGSLGVAFALHALGAYSIDVRVVPAIVLIVLGIAGIAAALASTARSQRDRGDHAAGENPAGDDPAGGRVADGDALADERAPVPDRNPEP